MIEKNIQQTNIDLELGLISAMPTKVIRLNGDIFYLYSDGSLEYVGGKHEKTQKYIIWNDRKWVSGPAYWKLKLFFKNNGINPKKHLNPNINKPQPKQRNNDKKNKFVEHDIQIPSEWYDSIIKLIKDNEQQISEYINKLNEADRTLIESIIPQKPKYPPLSFQKDVPNYQKEIDKLIKSLEKDKEPERRTKEVILLNKETKKYLARYFNKYYKNRNKIRRVNKKLKKYIKQQNWNNQFIK